MHRHRQLLLHVGPFHAPEVHRAGDCLHNKSASYPKSRGLFPVCGLHLPCATASGSIGSKGEEMSITWAEFLGEGKGIAVKIRTRGCSRWIGPLASWLE